MVQRQASGSQVTVPLATPVMRAGQPQRVDLGSSPVLAMPSLTTAVSTASLTREPSEGVGSRSPTASAAAANSSFQTVALTPGSMAAAGGVDGSMLQRDVDISAVIRDLKDDSLDEETRSSDSPKANAKVEPPVQEGGRWRKSLASTSTASP